jgi:LCP family protein required for cell wall assembly
MASGRPPTTPPNGDPQDRQGANEAGLLALGAAIDGPEAPESDVGPPVANEEGLLALGTAVDEAHGTPPPPRGGGGKGAHGRPGRRRHRKLKWALITIATVIVLLVGAVAGYLWYINNEIHRITVKNLSQKATSGLFSGTENVLLVGSTTRCGLAQQNPAYGLCSEGITGVNSDVVMILHLDSKTHGVSIISIPRDTFIPNARQEGANKIDAGLYEGPSQLVAAVQEDFGIPIQHFVELNFDTFANVVDALGGISMYFPMPVYDAYSGLNIQTPGCVHLNGTQALQVVRARHLQYKNSPSDGNNPANWPQESESDLARIRRNHEFLRVLASSMASKGLSNPITDQQIMAAVAPQLTVDSGFSASEMVSLILTFHGVNVGASPQLTLPVIEYLTGSYYYMGGNYGDVVFPYEPDDQNAINQALGAAPNINTMTGKPLPAPSTVTVSVLNGTGSSGQAQSTATALGALGFNMVGTGSANPVGNPAQTVVYFAQPTPADEAAAQAVAKSLSGMVVMALGPTADGAQVTVQTGTMFTVNPPAPPAPPTTQKPTTTTGGKKTTTTTTPPPATTTTIGTMDNGQFTTPTSNNEALAPWDPRSCTPTGGEGA